MISTVESWTRQPPPLPATAWLPCRRVPRITRSEFITDNAPPELWAVLPVAVTSTSVNSAFSAWMAPPQKVVPLSTNRSPWKLTLPPAI